MSTYVNPLLLGVKTTKCHRDEWRAYKDRDEDYHITDEMERDRGGICVP